jgi:hypothetical protein
MGRESGIDYTCASGHRRRLNKGLDRDKDGIACEKH